MLDIFKFLRDNHIPFIESGHHHTKIGWVQVNCPLCAGGRAGWHLGFSPTGVWNCWRCGGLEFWPTMAALMRTRDREAVRAAVAAAQTTAVAPVKAPKARPRTLRPPPGSGPLQPAHVAYLRGRGFVPEELTAEWGVLGTGPLSAAWSWRIVYPVRNSAGVVVAWQGRAIGNAKPRYKMTENDQCREEPKTFLYGIDRLAVGDSVLVVEGVTGVWRLGPGTVATFGIDWKRSQANQLRGFKRRYILFDPEPQAQMRAEELATHLALFPGTTEIITGFTTDPGEFTPAKVARIRQTLGLPAL